MRALPPVSPGVYPGGGQASLLRANEQEFLFQQQLILAGQASIAVQLERIKTSRFYPFAVSFQVWFTDNNGNASDPGNFELDVETSDVDADAQFAKKSALVNDASLNASFSGRVELVSSWAKFARVKLVSITNAVFTNVLVTL